MRFVERDLIEPPKAFSDEQARESRQLLLDLFLSGTLKRSQTRLKRRYDLTRHPDVVRALLDMFSGKCAFCESRLQSSARVHRFRPAEGAQPVSDPDTAHLYYAWLGEAWQNLYPICDQCVPQRPFYFPVIGGARSPLPDPSLISEYIERSDGRWPSFPPDESPKLLDPCYDRKLWRFLGFQTDGLAVPRGRDGRGRETIAHFNLNRPELVEARARNFERKLGELPAQIAGGIGVSMILEEGAPFAGAWAIYLRSLIRQGLGQMPSDNLSQAVGELVARPGWQNLLLRARDQSVRPERASMLVAGKSTPKFSSDQPPASVRLQNFKSLEDITFGLPKDTTTAEPVASSLLILGENAAGKSSILEALAIAMMAPEARRKLGLSSERYVLNPVFLGGEGAEAPDHATVELTYADSEAYTLTINAGSKRIRKGAERQDFVDSGPTPRLPLFAYGAYRQYLDAERRNVVHRFVRTMFATNQPLSNPEKWLARLKVPQFNMVVRALRAVFSIEGEFDVLEKIDGRIFVVERLGDEKDPVLRRTPIGIVSSGFRAVLAMLCDIMQGLMDTRINPCFESLETARGIVLIDEIEAHLHPRWKMAIMRGLREALPQVTFIATSHDPLCLRGMKPGEVMVLERIPGEQAETALPVSTQALVDLPDNAHWTIEQLLTADFFQLRSTTDIEAERRLARMQDRLAAGATPKDDKELREYLAEISSALPIGSTEVHRLVQEAVAAFLAEQRSATTARLKGLRKETRERILDALRSTA